MDVIFVYMTASGREEAAKIARHLVENRLAACVNILPGMTSVYRWEGKIEEGQEVVLIAKTVENRLEDLIAAVKSLHSYDCPCIVALPAQGGFAPFLEWVAAETRTLT